MGNRNNKKSDKILISLKKSMFQDYKEIEASCDYTMLGYYDGMNVKAITEWEDFRPTSAEIENQTPKTDDAILNIYSIRALAPNNTTKTHLQNDGFNYNLQNKRINKTYPLIACTLIHLTNVIVEKNDINEIIKQLADRITNTTLTDGTKIDMSDINCGIYFSLSYSDIILLFRVNNFEPVNTIMKNLNTFMVQSKPKDPNANRENCDNTKDLVNVISDSYTIIGYKNNNTDQLKNVIRRSLNTGNRCEYFLVSFTLQPGISFDQFRIALTKEIENFKKEVQEQFGNTPNLTLEVEDAIYGTFGNIDVMAKLVISSGAFPALYIKDADFVAPFHPESTLMNDIVSSLQSQPVFPIDGNYSFEKNDFTPNDNKKDCTCTDKIRKYQKDMDNFKAFSTKYGISMRNHDAIMQMLKNYHKLISTNHGFGVEPIISNFFNCFFLNLETDMAEINSVYENLASCEDRAVLEITLVKKINNTLESIRIFREYIGTYLNDLLRSGRSFIEGRIMTHPSIVSLTKLLFAYNGYVNTLINKINNAATHNTKHACVVVSGGCDYTRVNEIFSHRKTDTDNTCKMFVVSIPEITLFDIKGTLLRLGHECFHCFGNHHRELRFEKAIYAVHSYVADMCADYFFSDEALLLNYDDSYKENKKMKKWKHFMNDLKEHFYKNYFECVKKSDNDQIAVFCEDVQRGSAGSLNTSIQNAERIISRDYSVVKSYMRISADTNEYMRTFFGYICALILYELKKIYTFILENASLHDYNHKSHYENQLAIITYYLKDEWKNFEDGEFYESDCTNITDFCKINYGPINWLKRIFMKFTTPEQLDALESYESNENEPNKNNDLGITMYRYDGLIRIILDTMCECFADCMALNTLGMHKKDSDTQTQVGKNAAAFLLNFLYENSNCINAFPHSLEGVLRIGTDLKVNYGINKQLNSPHKSAIKKLHKNKDSDEIINRVNLILKDFNTYKMGTYISEYVNACVTEPEPPMKNEYNQIAETSKLTNEDIYNFLEFWRNYV